jgi:hypothetical protein
MDSSKSASDTDDSCNGGELIHKQTITATAWTRSVFMAAEAKVAVCGTNPVDASSPEAAAAERKNDSRNSEANEVTAQTRKAPQLYPPSISPSRDALTLAQLYHPSRRGLRHPRWKHPSSLPQSEGNASEDATSGMIGTPTAVPSHDTLTLTLAQLHHLSACSTVHCSTLSSEEAEQIWQEIEDHIGNTAEDDWSFNGSPHSTKSEEVIIPGAIAYRVPVVKDAAKRDRKRTKTSHNE